MTVESYAAPPQATMAGRRLGRRHGDAMSESRELGALMVGNGDAPVGLVTAAPAVEVRKNGGQVIHYGGELSAYVSPDRECIEFENSAGDAIGIPHVTLCAMIPALITYARHRSFIAPKAATDDLAGLARIVDGGGL